MAQVDSVNRENYASTWSGNRQQAAFMLVSVVHVYETQLLLGVTYDSIGDFGTWILLIHARLSR